MAPATLIEVGEIDDSCIPYREILLSFDDGVTLEEARDLVQQKCAKCINGMRWSGPHQGMPMHGQIAGDYTSYHLGTDDVPPQISIGGIGPVCIEWELLLHDHNIDDIFQKIHTRLKKAADLD